MSSAPPMQKAVKRSAETMAVVMQMNREVRSVSVVKVRKMRRGGSVRSMWGRAKYWVWSAIVPPFYDSIGDRG